MFLEDFKVLTEVSIVVCSRTEDRLAEVVACYAWKDKYSTGRGSRMGCSSIEGS